MAASNVFWLIFTISATLRQQHRQLRECYVADITSLSKYHCKMLGSFDFSDELWSPQIFAAAKIGAELVISMKGND
jgi:hypothetical protein